MYRQKKDPKLTPASGYPTRDLIVTRLILYLTTMETLFFLLIMHMLTRLILYLTTMETLFFLLIMHMLTS